MSNKFDFYELKAADRLPSPSGTALAIMKLVQRDDATSQQLAQLLQTDPALSGRVLGFANSAAFGARRPVANIQDAVVMIGMSAVRNFALSLSLVGKHSTGLCAGFDYAGYWSRSLMLAVAIAGIISRDRTASPEEAFTLGLLAEIGRLGLATAWPENYSKCISQARGRELLQLEQESFAIDHEGLSLLLLADWGLPGIFLDALKQSCQVSIDRADISRTARFARQLSFAKLVTDYCLADDRYRIALLPVLEAEAMHYSLDSSTLAAFITDLLLRWQEWGKLIDIKTEIADSDACWVESTIQPIPASELLLVDDDPLILAALSLQLAKEGYRVVTCRDGESALKHVIEGNISLILTDWHMEPMDGLQLCRTLRASVIGKNLYIIMMTVSENEEELVRAFAAGIDDFITKPIHFRVLLARLRAGQRIIKLQQELLQERKELERSTAELAVANRRLQHLANTDLLTTLPNRRYAISRLEQEWGGAQRFKRPLSVLVLDLDYFKSVNDTLGHDIGDQVLAHAAKVMRESIRANDVICRMGGEEFLAIAPDTDCAAALLLAERIRKAIEKRQLNDVQLSRPVTVSIGVACSIQGKPAWKELVKLADQAVYQVKKSGRNGVQLAPYGKEV